MAQQWVVLFDTLGVDTLIPWDELKQDDMLNLLSSKKPKNYLDKRVNMMVMRAQANTQRWPEVWAYDTAEDWSYEDMRQQWEHAPQATADAVRERGTNLFRRQRAKEVIV